MSHLNLVVSNPESEIQWSDHPKPILVVIQGGLSDKDNEDKTFSSQEELDEYIDYLRFMKLTGND